MIKSAEFQSTDVITIDKGSSVNVGITVEPTDLTEDEASHILNIMGIVVSNGNQSWVTARYTGYNNGVITANVTNVNIPDGTTIGLTLLIRYAPYPSNAYISTSNEKQIMGGITG